MLQFGYNLQWSCLGRSGLHPASGVPRPHNQSHRERTAVCANRCISGRRSRDDVGVDHGSGDIVVARLSGGATGPQFGAVLGSQLRSPWLYPSRGFGNAQSRVHLACHVRVRLHGFRGRRQLHRCYLQNGWWKGRAVG